MNKFIRLSGLGLALSSTFLGASCGSGRSSESSSSSGTRGPVYMLCFTSPTLPVVRVSGVFQIKTVSPTIMLEEPWSADFRRYVRQTGNEGGISVTCSQVTSQDAEKDKAAELRKQGHQVIETGWKYIGG
jgi:hypothetical protein